MPGWVNTADPLILVIAPATAKPILDVFIGDKGGDDENGGLCQG
jgi:hypothetical protein